MRFVLAIVFCAVCASTLLSQSPAQKIYETERAFEKAVAENGINAGFIEYLTSDGLIFNPDAQNGRDAYAARLRRT